VHLDLANADEPATADLALATFLEFGLKWAKGLEGRRARVEIASAHSRARRQRSSPRGPGTI
jgi:hypothetical protein